MHIERYAKYYKNEIQAQYSGICGIVRKTNIDFTISPFYIVEHYIEIISNYQKISVYLSLIPEYSTAKTERQVKNILKNYDYYIPLRCSTIGKKHKNS